MFVFKQNFMHSLKREIHLNSLMNKQKKKFGNLFFIYVYCIGLYIGIRTKTVSCLSENTKETIFYYLQNIM